MSVCVCLVRFSEKGIREPEGVSVSVIGMKGRVLADDLLSGRFHSTMSVDEGRLLISLYSLVPSLSSHTAMTKSFCHCRPGGEPGNEANRHIRACTCTLVTLGLSLSFRIS